MKNLLVTVGDSPLPVLLTIIGLEPDQVAFIVDDTSTPEVTPEHVVQRILDTAKQMGQEVASHSIRKVPRYDVDGITKAVDKALEEDDGGWHVGYSGGSPTMAMTALRQWSAKFPPTPVNGVPPTPQEANLPGSGKAWYVQGGRLLATDGETRDVPLAGAPDLATVLNLHGWQVTSQAPLVELSQAASEKADELEIADKAFEGLPPRLSAQAGAQRNGKLANDTRLRLREVLPPEYALHGPVTLKRGDHTLDLDAVAVRGLSLIVFGFSAYVRCERCSCALLVGLVAERKEEAFALDLQAKVFGGLQAASVFIVYQASHGTQAKLQERCQRKCKYMPGAEAAKIVAQIQQDLDSRDFARQKQLVTEVGQLTWLSTWLQVIA